MEGYEYAVTVVVEFDVTVTVEAGTVTKTVEGVAVLQAGVELALLVVETELDEVEDVCDAEELLEELGPDDVEENEVEEGEGDDVNELVVTDVDVDDPLLVDVGRELVVLVETVVDEVLELVDATLVLELLDAIQEHALDIRDADAEQGFANVGRGAVHVVTVV